MKKIETFNFEPGHAFQVSMHLLIFQLGPQQKNSDPFESGSVSKNDSE